MKKSLVSALVAAALMASAATLATAMTPTKRIVDVLPKLDLEASIPERFGDWTLDKRAVGGVVNPQQTELLNQLYSQILTRTYYNAQGYRIMLSIAYGEDQRDGNQLHYPEVCYPAQGFQVTSNRKGTLDTDLGGIPVKRLETNLSQNRFEPITYWTTIGSQVLTGGATKKLAEMRYGLKGEIPDGLLFRISSIDRNSEAAFAVQQQFVNQLVTAIPADVRPRIAGL
ncbi:exosortase-associated protein EpsI, B-type [Methyloversatilis sp. MC4-4]|uniref:exosortase-associated protein EpsI, B-type n=1 Tax=Methyloversatilis sp. MC4-4 TaxID=3132824 RepID=UPI003CEC8F59